MATYEWVCNDCRLLWGREYKLGGAPSKTKCPECRKLSERLFYATPAHFKGSGFYATDYKEISSVQDDKEFYRVAIENTKDRAKNQHYRRYELTSECVEEGLKDGRIVRNTDEETKNIRKAEKALATDIFKRADIDPATYAKSKPQ